ncbi:hypothetical protein ACQ4PT_042024 [Festuca glaucescens]
MDKGLFANDGSFMERFKQMQQEKEKAAPAGASASAPAAAPKPVNPKTPIVIPMNKRPLEVKKAAPVLSGGKLAFSLKKNKAPILPVKFGAEEDDDEDDVGGVKREDHAKRHKSTDAPSAAAPAGAVGNHFLHLLLLLYFFLVTHSAGSSSVIDSTYRYATRIPVSCLYMRTVTWITIVIKIISNAINLF